MKDFQIISDGSCDLTNDEVKKLGLIVVPFYISVKKDEHLKVGEQITIENLYNQMMDDSNLFPKTSQPTPQDYLKVFQEAASSGKDIICICIAKNFSGSYNSASIAKDMLLEEYPDAKVSIVDSTCVSLAQGLFVKEVCRMKQNNLTHEEILNHLDKLKESSRIFFTVNDLNYLYKGGRIGKVSAIIGKTFKLNVVILMKDSAIKSTGKALSRARSLLQVQTQVADHFKKIGAKIEDYIISIGFGHSKDEGTTFRSKMSNILNANFEMYQIGATIAVHTGPQSIGVALMKKYDT